MIKVNVEINKKSWVKKIKNPKEYFHYKLKKISNNIILFKKKSFVFTILLTNSLQIRKLNQKFRKKNKPTDVLSFPFFSTKDLKNFKKGKIYLGDLAICYEIINKRSKKNQFFNRI